MANHYIRADATGANDGSSWANAWPTFASVTWTRGDTYYVAGGIYNETVSILKAPSGTTWIRVKKANAADNSTDAGWSALYASTLAQINGQLQLKNGYISWDGVTGSGNTGHGFKVYVSTLAGNGIVATLESDGSFYELAHTEIMGSGYAAGATGQDGVYITGTAKKGNWVHHCYIHELTRNGVTLGAIQGTSLADYGLLFENNVLERSGGCTDGNVHGQGIQVSYGGQDTFNIVRNNLFQDINGSGFIYFLGGAGSIHSDFHIYNNVFYYTGSTPCMVSPGPIGAHDFCDSLDRVYIYNNTFYGIGNLTDRTPARFMMASSNGGSRTDIYAYNNIWESCYFNAVHSPIITQQNNGYFGNTAINPPPSDYGVPHDTLGQVNGSATTFTNALIGDFSLITGGYAIGAGVGGVDLGATGVGGIIPPNPSNISNLMSGKAKLFLFRLSRNLNSFIFFF